MKKIALFALVFALSNHSHLFAQTEPAKKADVSPDKALDFDGLKASPEAFKKKVDLKVGQLMKYFDILCDKKDAHFRNAIDQAMLLFNKNENRLVTISSKKTGEPETKLIRKYLNNLSNLPYDHVDIKWNNMQYVSSFTKHPDGTWYGFVTFEQTFTGYNKENQPIYTDVTMKNVEIQVMVWDFIKDGKVMLGWDVFFSNISVADSKKV